VPPVTAAPSELAPRLIASVRADAFVGDFRPVVGELGVFGQEAAVDPKFHDGAARQLLRGLGSLPHINGIKFVRLQIAAVQIVKISSIHWHREHRNISIAWCYERGAATAEQAGKDDHRLSWGFHIVCSTADIGTRTALDLGRPRLELLAVARLRVSVTAAANARPATCPPATLRGCVTGPARREG
jgi:hypothetical protein